MEPGTNPVLTIGHSTRPLDVFLALLDGHGVERLVDVRTVPRSARHPHFDRERLPGALIGPGIAYAHVPELGGLRRPRPDSTNRGWRNDGFRGFADHMQTAAFSEALEALIASAVLRRTAIMCAEAVPWRCHRSLISDALVARGLTVEHILGEGPRGGHRLTPFARLESGRVTYPAPQARLPGLP